MVDGTKRRLVWSCVIVFGAGMSVAHADQLVWAMAGGGNGHLWKIDASADTKTLINSGGMFDPVGGDVGDGWSTDAETPDKTLYFLRRFQSDINVYKVDSTAIHVNGSNVLDNLTFVGPTGLGDNLDGLTAGPDGNLYLTAYFNNAAGHPVNGLYRYHPGSGVLDFVGTFAGDAGPNGVNSFYTDLSFDPVTGDLFGTGFSGNGTFGVWRLNGTAVQTMSNQSFTYSQVFTTGFLDGLAFDRVTGQLYMSSDTGGVAEVNRTTGAFIRWLANSQGTEIGTDLAVQSDTIPTGVPEPTSILLFGTVLAGVAVIWRRRSCGLGPRKGALSGEGLS